ncbi:MAG TPA: type II secretion system protein [bacterium]|nr:type II secretion system protein [bacterium]
MNKQKAFTLIELLVVISIIGLLSTLAIVSLNGARAKARDAKRMNDLKSISDALEVYYIDNDEYPKNTRSGDCNYGNNIAEEIYVDSAGGYICSGYGFYSLFDKIPSPPNAQEKYEYNYDTPKTPPCVFTTYMESGILSFGCKGGNCKRYDNIDECAIN